jgi:hypothetical protein
LPEAALDVRDNAPLIAAGGGLLLFISLFIDWFDVLGSAWEFMDIVDVVLAVLALICVGIGAMLATGNTTNLPSSPGGIVTTSGVIAFSIVATFILEGDDQKFGIFLALIGTIAMIVGGMQLARAGVAPARRTRRAEPPPPPSPPPAGPTV